MFLYATTVLFHHINHKLVEVTCDYQAEGMQFIATGSNDVEYFPEEN
ncbi:hypothetical protein J4E06_17830 [Muricauda sp. NFXS6]